MIQFSVVVPVKDEERSLPILMSELKQVVTSLHQPYEIIFIDDGSNDNSRKIIKNFQNKDSRIKLVAFRSNFGKSEALAAGLAKARGAIIITLDADLQDDPTEIPKLLRVLRLGHYDLVCGWRKNRADTWLKKVSSLLFNKGTVLISGINLHDFNCGLKIFTKEVANELSLHGELHRFIPILAAKRKFKITELAVRHRPRRYGKSKYGLERGWRGIIDLLTIVFLTDYAGKPAHFFGKIGLLFFTLGFMMDAYVAFIRLATGTTQARIPMLLAGILLMVLGMQLLSTGLIAEMIAHYFILRKRNNEKFHN